MTDQALEVEELERVTILLAVAALIRDQEISIETFYKALEIPKALTNTRVLGSQGAAAFLEGVLEGRREATLEEPPETYIPAFLRRPHRAYIFGEAFQMATEAKQRHDAAKRQTQIQTEYKESRDQRLDKLRAEVASNAKKFYEGAPDQLRERIQDGPAPPMDLSRAFARRATGVDGQDGD